MLGRTLWGVRNLDFAAECRCCSFAYVCQITRHVGCQRDLDDLCGFEVAAMRVVNTLDHRPGLRRRVVLSVVVLVLRPIYEDLGTVLRIQVGPR